MLAMVIFSSNAKYFRWANELRVLDEVAVGREKLLQDYTFYFDAEDDERRNTLQPQESQLVSSQEQLEQLKLDQGEKCGEKNGKISHVDF
jgi:hypothetical protein